jgi:hypothetical protein
MDAPKGRYRIEEKDGRLVVFDTATGSRLSPSFPSPPGTAPGAPPPPAGGIARSPGIIDRIGRRLLSLTVSRWDEQGRAILAWEWEQNGHKRRWDAALDPAQQKRLGRAMVAFTAFPLFVLLTIGTGGSLLWLFPLALPATLWGIWAIIRLNHETNGGGPGGPV